MKRALLLALVVVSAAACKTGTAQSSRQQGSLARQYDPQTYQTSHGDLDRAIGQR